MENMTIQLDLSTMIKHLHLLSRCCPKNKHKKYEYFYMNFNSKYIHFCNELLFGKIKFDYNTDQEILIYIQNNKDFGIKINIHKFQSILNEMNSTEQTELKLLITNKIPTFILNEKHRFTIEYDNLYSQYNLTKTVTEMVKLYDLSEFDKITIPNSVGSLLKYCTGFTDKYDMKIHNAVSIVKNNLSCMASTRLFESKLPFTLKDDTPFYIPLSICSILRQYDYEESYSLFYNNKYFIFQSFEADMELLFLKTKSNTVIPVEEDILKYISFSYYIDLNIKELRRKMLLLNHFYREDSKPCQVVCTENTDSMIIGYSGDDDIITLNVPIIYKSPELIDYCKEFNAYYILLALDILSSQEINIEDEVVRLYIHPNYIGMLIVLPTKDKHISYKNIEKKILLINYV